MKEAFVFTLVVAALVAFGYGMCTISTNRRDAALQEAVEAAFAGPVLLCRRGQVSEVVLYDAMKTRGFRLKRSLVLGPRCIELEFERMAVEAP